MGNLCLLFFGASVLTVFIQKVGNIDGFKVIAKQYLHPISSASTIENKHSGKLK